MGGLWSSHIGKHDLDYRLINKQLQRGDANG
ncbi:hypothetical protein N752_06590 [Desulforamulus aquiferis]|nr:hypothetical protein N752_06590 [Desulforamulus aquiferis]